MSNTPQAQSPAPDSKETYNPENHKKITEVLRSCQEDRARLMASTKEAFSKISGQAIDGLESAFPHTRGDGSVNERQFVLARKRVLDTMGAASRELEVVFNCNFIQELVVRQVATYVVPPKPDGTPAGVTIRNPK